MTADRSAAESPTVPAPWEHAGVAGERHETSEGPAAAVALVLGAGGPTSAAWLAGALDGLAIGPGGAPPTSRRPADPLLALRAALRRPPRAGLILEGVRPVPTTVPIGLPPRHATTEADRRTDAPWPEGLWLCTLRLPDGRRVVFGRDDHPGTSTDTAVRAACSDRWANVPVTIGARRYVDASAWSATNADLVAGLGFDVVVVVVPATTAWWQRRQLRAEVGRIHRADAPVLVLEQATGGHDDPTAAADAAAASVAARLRAEPAWARRLRMPSNR